MDLRTGTAEFARILGDLLSEKTTVENATADWQDFLQRLSQRDRDTLQAHVSNLTGRATALATQTQTAFVRAYNGLLRRQK